MTPSGLVSFRGPIKEGQCPIWSLHLSLFKDTSYKDSGRAAHWNQPDGLTVEFIISMREKPPVLAIFVIVFLAVNLRPVMASLGPLLDVIEQKTRITSVGAGLLTTLPVFFMGLGAFANRAIRGWIGSRRGIALGIGLVGLACAFRLIWADATGMFLTASVAGLGIAIVQALVPGVIKRWFHVDHGRVMGLYSTGIMAGAALAAASVADIARGADWRFALAVWAIPAFLSLFLWVSCPLPAEGTHQEPTEHRPSFFQIPRAWLLMVFFGVGTGAYTLVLAWLPPFYMELGQSREVGGYLLAGLTLAEVAAGLGVSALVHRFPDRRAPLIGVLLCLLAGLGCLMAAPVSLSLVAVALLGIGIGALFPLSLIVTLDHASDPVEAGDLAAFVQGGGYMIASAMPLIAGLIRDQSATLSDAWFVMSLGGVVLVLMSLRFSPERSVL